jgi:hypothetical protein
VADLVAGDRQEPLALDALRREHRQRLADAALGISSMTARSNRPEPARICSTSSPCRIA